MNKTELLKIITQYSKEYHKNLNNKNFIILAKSKNNIISFNIIFNSTNYLHLTGVTTPLSAQEFFDACLNNKLTLNMFAPKYNSNIMNAKMNAIPHLVNIHKLARNIGDYNNLKPNLYTDKILGNVGVSLGLVYPKEKKTKKYMQPNSLMSEDSRILSKKPFLPIIAILIKDIKDKKFDTITYKSKNINIDKLHFPKEITELLTEKAMLELKPSIKNIELKKDLPDTEKEALSEQQPTAPAKKSIYAMAMENQKAKKQPTYNKNKNDISL